MRFLRELFHEELDADGDINIAGETFLRRDILRQMAPETYELAYNEWKDAREDQLQKKAGTILAAYDNSARFSQLLSAFATGSMVPFIGAGMSMPSGLPSWTKFLIELCAESHVSPAVIESLLEDGKYEDAAQALHDDLGAGLFNENVEAAFSRQCAVGGALNYIPKLFPGGTVLLKSAKVFSYATIAHVT